MFKKSRDNWENVRVNVKFKKIVHVDSNSIGEKMDVKFLKRSFLQRLMGLPVTVKAGIDGCWNYSDGKLTIDLGKASELKTPGLQFGLKVKTFPNGYLLFTERTESIARFTIGAPIWDIADWIRFPEPALCSAAALTSQLTMQAGKKSLVLHLIRSPFIL